MPTLKLLFSMMRFLNLQIDNPYAIANIFNNFFVNVGINTNKDIPNGNCCRTFLLKGNFPDSVEVDSYISQWTITKSIGPYSIPVLFLIILKTQITPASFIPN